MHSLCCLKGEMWGLYIYISYVHWFERFGCLIPIRLRVIGKLFAL